MIEIGLGPAGRTRTGRDMTETPQDGAGRIAAERRRQVEQEGWTPEHDAEHDGAQLARAAAVYALHAAGVRSLPTASRTHQPLGEGWPWPDWEFKPADDPIRTLTKAGALIAAEIDRLFAERKGKN